MDEKTFNEEEFDDEMFNELFDERWFDDELFDIDLKSLKENSIELGLGDLSGGVTKTPEYMAHRNMKYRCQNPNCPLFQYYGGRGISVTPRWERFAPFLFDMGRKLLEDQELDRIDPDGNYSPDNCRWAWKSTNMRNRRDVKLNLKKAEEIRVLAEQGDSIKELAEKYGVSKRTIKDVIEGKTWKDF